MLTLASNERIPLTPTMRLLLEINHMNHCSPATVSRGGVVFVNGDDVGWKPAVDSWIESLEVRSVLKVWLDMGCLAGEGISAIADGAVCKVRGCLFGVLQKKFQICCPTASHLSSNDHLQDLGRHFTSRVCQRRTASRQEATGASFCVCMHLGLWWMHARRQSLRLQNSVFQMVKAASRSHSKNGFVGGSLSGSLFLFLKRALCMITMSTKRNA